MSELFPREQGDPYAESLYMDLPIEAHLFALDVYTHALKRGFTEKDACQIAIEDSAVYIPSTFDVAQLLASIQQIKH